MVGPDEAESGSCWSLFSSLRRAFRRNPLAVADDFGNRIRVSVRSLFVDFLFRRTDMVISIREGLGSQAIAASSSASLARVFRFFFLQEYAIFQE